MSKSRKTTYGKNRHLQMASCDSPSCVKNWYRNQSVRSHYLTVWQHLFLVVVTDVADLTDRAHFQKLCVETTFLMLLFDGVRRVAW